LFRSLKYLRKGMFSVFISLSMLFSLLLLLPFKSYGIFEIVYFTLILIWNIHFLYNRMKEEGSKSKMKGFLKFFQ
jgi:succinate-acetate transporter protein